MPPKDVPDIVVRRLPYYLRALGQAAQRGETVVSSQALGAWLGVSPAQIRKDLSYFGEFGKQGRGYEVAYLRDQLRAILHADRTWPVVLVGAGALGTALAHYPVFSRGQFPIVALFDNDPEKFGRRLREDLVVQPVAEMEQAICDRGISLGILAVPAEAAQEVAEGLVACGIRAILNYAPIRLSLPAHIHVQDIDPVAVLQSMTYYL
jgi:redox-sensing transcriptional repressor